MTIQRSKRAPRRVDPGRPKRLNIPPSSIGGPNVVLDLFTSTDLEELTHVVGLSFASSDGIPSGVTAINEAFSNFANAMAMQVDDSPAGERRDWCAGVARAAADLHRSLGHTEYSLVMEPLAFAAAASLRRGWPADPQTPEAATLQEDVRSALSFALPDKYAGAEDRKSALDFDEGMWNLLGRLGPALRALSLLATAAQDGWGAELLRGKGRKERGRRYLMDALVPTFTRLFGRPPTAFPGSIGFQWFSALITKAGRVAGDQGRLSDQGKSKEAQARAAALQAVEAIARHIAPLLHKTETKGTAKLDHWIRDALAASGTRQTKAAIEAAPPGSARTREPKTESR